MSWRKANGIDLPQEGHFLMVSGFKGEAVQNLTYVVGRVFGSDVLKLARAFCPDGGPAGKETSFDVEIYPGELEDWKVDGLEAAIEGGVLHYRVRYKDPRSGEVSTWDEYAYNGRFTVHWA